MNIFSRLFRSRDKPENRTSGSGYRFFMGGSTSGKTVTERSAMQMTAVHSCVRVLSEAIAGLPLHLYMYEDDGSREKATDHPLYFLLHNEPNPEMTSFVFRETLMTHLLLWGNAYAQIICRTHNYYKEKCSMATIKNEVLELAFTLIMNKLIYASEEMLKPFFIELTEKNRTMDCMDMEKVDEKLEKNRESMRKLLEVMTKGCLDAAAYSRENLTLAREADELAKAKERLASSKGEIYSFEMEIKALYDFARHSDYLKEFDGDLFTRFVDRIIVYSKHEIAFKLKCGLTLTEGV